VITLHSNKDELLAAISEKKTLLNHSTKLASSWNTNRFQSSGNTQMSRAHVKILQKEIKVLQLELSRLDK